jgi:hypothetical protein
MGAVSYEAVPDENDALCDALRYRDIVLDENGCDSNNLAPMSDDDDTAMKQTMKDTEVKFEGWDTEDPAWLPIPSSTSYTPPYCTASCARRPLLRVSHVIISRTARLVALCGARIDTMLRIRHGALPCFHFLFSDSELRPYFEAMVEVKAHGMRKLHALVTRHTLHFTRHTSHPSQHYSRNPLWDDSNDTDGSDCIWARHLLALERVEREDALSAAATSSAATSAVCLSAHAKEPDYSNIVVFIIIHFAKRCSVSFHIFHMSKRSWTRVLCLGARRANPTMYAFHRRD